ncbi:MAG: kinase [Lachnospiraceae bacterium]|nr:kinase [Lachnospiraceae bacterium]
MIITRTPLRISFFGGGTDLPDYYTKFGGEVLSTTIDKYLYITCRHMPPFWEYSNRFVYGSKTELVSRIDEIEHPSIRETLRYMNINDGIDLHYNTDIPARSGIGSSSSFTVGLLNALYGLNGKIISKEELAAQAIHIEQNLIKEAVGSQDQTAAAFGGFNYILFKKNGDIQVMPMTLPSEKIQLLNAHLILVFTGFQRFAQNIEKEKMRTLESHYDNLGKMKGYVKQAVDILNTNTDICAFGELLNETWNEKKALSEKVSDSRIDDMYRHGLQHGAIGGKLLGAGGGGFMLFFVEPCNQKRFLEAFSGYVHVPFRFEDKGSSVIYYKPDIGKDGGKL